MSPLAWEEAMAAIGIELLMSWGIVCFPIPTLSASLELYDVAVITSSKKKRSLGKGFYFSSIIVP